MVIYPHRFRPIHAGTPSGMRPLDIDTALAWRGRTVLDRDGEKIGTLDDILLDARTDLPAWGGVRTGLFGRKESYIPLDVVDEADDEALRVPFAKAKVTEAPAVDPDVAMMREEEDALFGHYGREQPAGDTGEANDAPEAGAVSQASAGGVSAGAEEDAPEAEMVRSEEEIRTGTTGMRPTERVRLKKVLVTDEVKKTVPVRREEVRLETDPPPEGRAAAQDAPAGEDRPAPDPAGDAGPGDGERA
jgi:PRC-barrel domain/Domain of unknown function (DUF2382)